MRPAVLKRICGGNSRPNVELLFNRGDTQIDRRIAYSRSGTGVPMQPGPDGLLAFGPHNLCQRSYAIHAQTNRLDDSTRWSANTSEIGPDGYIGGSKFTAKAATSWGAQGVVYQNGTQAFVMRSCAFIVKKGNHRYIAIRTGGAATGSPEKYNFYDFDTDTVNNSNIPSMPIVRTYLSNGWVRLQLTCAPIEATSLTVACVKSDGDVQTSPAGTEFVYVYSGQLNLGPDQPYIETPAAAEGWGLRITYNPMSKACEGMLVEHSKTNAVLRSAALTNASNWELNQASGTITSTANAGTAPDGSSSAVLLTVTSAAFPRLCTTAAAPLTLDASAEYCASLFVKYDTLDQICLWIRNGVGGTEVVQATFTFSTKTFTFAVGSLAGYDEFPGGWIRIWVKGTRDATGTTGSLWITPGDGYTATTRTGTVYVWGPQVEMSSNMISPTSYIPTGSVALTRGIEFPEIAGSLLNGWYKSNRPCTILMKVKLKYYAYYQAILCIAASASGDEITPYVGPTGRITVDVKSNVVDQTAALGEPSPFPDNSIYTICFRIAENNMLLVGSSGTISRDFNAALPLKILDRLSLMSNRARNSATTYSSNLLEFKHWPRALSDSQMRALVGV